MTEELLHFVWKLKYFNHESLKTSNGEPVTIIYPGEYNTNAGPDFLNARINIGSTTWAGNIEIHRKASEWTQHGHQNDEAYGNVILHVVYEEDGGISNPVMIPTIELKNRISHNVLSTYSMLKNSISWIPCEDIINNVSSINRDMWLERMALERLEIKSGHIQKLLEEENNDWASAFYIQLSKNMGFKVNSSAFELLARSVPWKIILKYANSRLQLESLLMGQAGFLEGVIKDDYARALQKEYNFLRNKHNLQTLENHRFKYLRMRPSNFPAIRLSQLADLLSNAHHLFSQVLETNSLKNARALLQASATEYWVSHTNIDKPLNKPVTKGIGKSSIDNLIINTVIPVLFSYGEIKDKPHYKERALSLLESLPAENNIITRNWHERGMPNRNAMHSQSLISLKNNYCSLKKCLSCGIGSAILKPRVNYNIKVYE
ncbi:MAG: DUF2851 family protein [Bacteroidota bacterium]|nr:DUF2851 family protein [Bacteroidota bacterium]